MKNLIYCLFIALLWSACGNSEATDQQADRTDMVLEGQTMGTYYRVTYDNAKKIDYQKEIDNLLQVINQDVSTWIKTSTISNFNQSPQALTLGTNASEKHQHFLTNWKAAQKIYEETEGNFDPTVMPLVNYWGFGYEGKNPVTAVDSTKVDSLLKFVGLNHVQLDEANSYTLKKDQAGVQLDYSALAKGYGVDQVGKLLEKKGVQNYLVDIGGEVRAIGKNSKGDLWKIGINLPKEGAPTNEIKGVISLNNKSVATSGNYRNYYEVEGNKYSHTINPFNGFPERSKLLSSSVVAEDCMTADGYATAFMVMGLEKAMELAQQTPGLEAYFIYGDDAGGFQVAYTDGMKAILDLEEE